VADHTAPVVRVLDRDGRQISALNIKGPASLATGPSGTIVYAIQSDADIVHAIDSGITLDDHGDHEDPKLADPRLWTRRWKAPGSLHILWNSVRPISVHSGKSHCREPPVHFSPQQ
jgi:hypothetical protein